MRRPTTLLRLLAWSTLYFVLSLGMAMIARGPDLDRLPTRSPLAQAAHGVSRLLWAPHDAAVRAVGPTALRRPGVIPALLLANTLAWGAGLAFAAHALRRHRRRRID